MREAGGGRGGAAEAVGPGATAEVELERQPGESFSDFYARKAAGAAFDPVAAATRAADREAAAARKAEEDRKAAEQRKVEEADASSTLCIPHTLNG